MKSSPLSFILLCCFLVACERAKDASRPSSGQPPSQQSPARTSKVPLAPAAIDQLRKDGIALLLTTTADGMVAPDSLKKFQELAPQLAEADVLMDIIGSVPNEQLPIFKAYLLAALEKYSPKSGRAMDPNNTRVLEDARRLHSPEMAAQMFAHLARVPAYEFPADPPPQSWFDTRLADLYDRGVQGRIASTVVQFGDEPTMRRYREQLRSASPGLQRLMIWALGRSPDMADFELLWSLREKITDPGAADTLKRALNAMIVTMQGVARYPTSQTNRTGLKAEELEAQATVCRQRLKEANLVVELTMWD